MLMLSNMRRTFDSSCSYYSRCFKSLKRTRTKPGDVNGKSANPNLENTAHVPPSKEEESIFMEIPKPKAKQTVNVEIKDLNSPRPIPSKLPYPERLKVRENDKPSAQHSRFLKIFKQLRLEIGLKDALVEMPKFNKWLSSLLRNKEKLEEIAITTRGYSPRFPVLSLLARDVLVIPISTVASESVFSTGGRMLQNRYQGNNFNSNQNRGGNFNQNRQNNQGAVYQAPPYQPPTNQPLVNQALPPVSQIQGVSKTDFESYAKANDANMNNLQMKLDNFQRNQNDFQRSYNDSQKKQDDFQNLMLGFMQNYHNNSTASTSRPGTLPSQTVTNPREHVNAITTRSGKTLEEPSTPLVPTTPVVSNPQKEPEQNPETSTEKVQNPNLENTAHVPPPEEEESIFMEIPKPKAKKTVNVEIQDLNSPRPIPSKLPYPERLKVRENDKPSAQHSRFLKMFKQLRLEIGLKDALVEMPKFNKWLSSLLRNKEKLEEIAITTVNAECSAIIMNKVPEKLEDPGKFLIPCALQELNRTSALADSGASINLLPHSIYKKLGLEALTPTRMTQLSSICTKKH
ncbi:reverse transcriptase domain-containing protein [Tanacetum coccineum]